jgi:GTP-binding protein
LTKQRVLKALEAAKEVYDNKTRKIPTRKLNDILLPIIQATPPPNIKGKFVLIKFISQLPTKNPNFAFWCNLPQYINEPYKRFIENQMRLQFNFTGVPIELVFKKK